MMGCMLIIVLVFCFVLWRIFTFWVPCWDVRYYFRNKTMFSSSLSLVVGRRVHVLFVFVCVYCVALFFALCTLCCQFLLNVHFWLPLLYCLRLFIISNIYETIGSGTVYPSGAPELTHEFSGVRVILNLKCYVNYLENIVFFFSFDHYVVCPASIDCPWLLLWYL
jgi:hypothetical protein